MNKFQVYGDLHDDPSILDFICFYTCNHRESRSEAFWSCFSDFLIKSFSSASFKNELIFVFNKAIDWLHASLADVLFQVSGTTTIMRSYFESALPSLAVFKIFRREVVDEGGRLALETCREMLTTCSEHLLNFQVNILEDPSNARILVLSGNWTLWLKLLGVVEAVTNSNFDIIEDAEYQYSCYSVFTRNFRVFMFRHMFGVLRMRSAADKLEVLRTMERVSLNVLSDIEALTETLAQGESRTQGYGPFRVGAVEQYLGLILFVKYFVTVDGDTLALKGDMVSEKSRAEFAENVGLDAEQRRALYSKLMRNYVFYLLRLAGIKRKYDSQMSTDKVHKSGHFFCVLFNCLFYLDRVFADELTRSMQGALDDIIASGHVDGCQHYVKKLFFFLYEITLNENVFEELYCTLALQFGLDDHNSLSARQMEAIAANAPSLGERLSIVLKHIPYLSVDRLFECVQFLYVESSSTTRVQFTEFLLEKNFSFNASKRRFKLRRKRHQVHFYQNLFYTEEDMYSRIVVKLKEKRLRLKEIELYYWRNGRARHAFDYLRSNGLIDWLVAYYYRLKRALAQAAGRSGAVHLESDSVAEMILVYSQIIENKLIIDNFFCQIYKHSGDALNLLLGELIEKWNCRVPVSMENLICPPEGARNPQSRSVKHKASKLMAKIQKRAKKRSKAESAPQDAQEPRSANEVCLVCNEPFSAQRPGVLMCKMHLYNPETLIEDSMASLESYHMFTSCGHRVHFACRADEDQLRCSYCQFQGRFLVSELSANAEQLLASMDQFMEANLGISNRHYFLTSPFLQSIRVLKLVSEDRLAQNIMPVLRTVASMLLSDCPRLWDGDMCSISASRKLSIEEELAPLIGDADEASGQSLGQMCPEFQFGKAVVYSHFEDARRPGGVEEGVEKGARADAKLTETIKRYFWRFAVLKLLQKEPRTLEEINEELIISECYDMFHVLFWLEQSLRGGAVCGEQSLMIRHITGGRASNRQSWSSSTRSSTRSGATGTTSTAPLARSTQRRPPALPTRASGWGSSEG